MYNIGVMPVCRFTSLTHARTQADNCVLPNLQTRLMLVPAESVPSLQGSLGSVPKGSSSTSSTGGSQPLVI